MKYEENTKKMFKKELMDSNKKRDLPAIIRFSNQKNNCTIKSLSSYLIMCLSFKDEWCTLSLNVDNKVSKDTGSNAFLNSIDIIYALIYYKYLNCKWRQDTRPLSILYHKAKCERIYENKRGNYKINGLRLNISKLQVANLVEIIISVLENTIYINNMESVKKKYFEKMQSNKFSKLEHYILIDEIQKNEKEVNQNIHVTSCVGKIYNKHAIEYLKLCVKRNKSELHEEKNYKEITKKSLKEYCNMMNSNYTDIYYTNMDMGNTIEFTMDNKVCKKENYTSPMILRCPIEVTDDSNYSKIMILNNEENCHIDIPSKVNVEIITKSNLENEMSNGDAVDLIKHIIENFKTTELVVRKKINQVGTLNNSKFIMYKPEFKFETVHFFNCLNGLATVIEDSKTESIIYDFGISTKDKEYIKFAKSKKIKTVIISHWHHDHYKGFVGFKHTNEFLNCFWIFNDYFKGIMACEVIYAVLKYHTLIGLKNKIVIFDKNKDYNENYSNNCMIFSVHGSTRNKNSIGLYNKVENKRFLMSGDGDYAKYGELDCNYLKNLNYLQISHHGGECGVKTPKASKPNGGIAVLSSGKNGFGHPVKQRMEDLKTNNFIIIRTSSCNNNPLDSCNKCVGKTVKYTCKIERIQGIKL